VAGKEKQRKRERQNNNIDGSLLAFVILACILRFGQPARLEFRGKLTGTRLVLAYLSKDRI
jgi:hypothetical protein